jgi:ABC-type lipoprotein release transport system permease subunit
VSGVEGVVGMILFDVAKLVMPGVGVGLVAILASLAHARRAASVQPMVAMRSV